MAKNIEYKILGKTMDEIANCTRMLAGVNEELSPEEIIYWLKRVALTTDAKINLEEVVSILLNIDSKISIGNINDEVAVELSDVPDNIYEDSVGLITINPQITVFGFTDEIILNNNSGDKMLNYEEYNTRYIASNLNSAASIITEWEYKSNEETIDSGRITVVSTITNDLGSVEEVTVSD